MIEAMVDREGECPGTVAFISCLDSEIDDLGVILYISLR